MNARPPRRSLAAVVVLLLGLVLGIGERASAQNRLEPHYRAQRPSGAGPFPTIMLVPGCGGISAPRVQTADRLVGHGYAVVFVDYLAVRGLQIACGKVSPDDVAKDIQSVSAHLRSLGPEAPADIGVVGWSLGGAGVFASLRASRQDQPPPFSVAAAFYPPCARLRAWSAKIPVLVLLAGKDDIAPPEPCQELVRSVGPGAPVEVRLYPEARHSFDSTDLAPVVPSRAFPGKTAGHDPEATTKAWTDVVALFGRQLRPAK